MTALQSPVPTLFRLWPVAKHRCKFAVLIETGKSREYPYDLEDVVVAVCVSGCDKKLTAAEIEEILDRNEMR